VPRKIHIANSTSRDATISIEGCNPPPGARPGLPDRAVRFRRYLATSEQGLDESLKASLGEGYGQALVDGDPEVDIEVVGQTVSSTDTVFLSSSGEVLYNSPRVLEVVMNPDGTEVKRRAPEDQPSNVNDELPLRWTGRTFKKSDAVRRFAFRRSVQLRHVDGLTYDFLFNMAKELHTKDEMVLVAGGPKGKHPLIFTMNGTPYRGLLEGRISGDKYILMLHLSNMELKRPE